MPKDEYQGLEDLGGRSLSLHEKLFCFFVCQNAGPIRPPGSEESVEERLLLIAKEVRKHLGKVLQEFD